jgi:hypothetical protein
LFDNLRVHEQMARPGNVKTSFGIRLRNPWQRVWCLDRQCRNVTHVNGRVIRGTSTSAMFDYNDGANDAVTDDDKTDDDVQRAPALDQEAPVPNARVRLRH